MNTKDKKLSDIGNKNPFNVPKGYFDTISNDIMMSLPEKEVKEPIKTSLWTKMKPWVYMAAMFVGTFFFMQVLFNSTSKNQDKSTNEYSLATDKYWYDVQISEDEFYEYIEDQLINDGYYDYMYNQVSF